MSEDLDGIEAANSSSLAFIALKNGWVLGLNAAIVRFDDFEKIENISKIILHSFGADPFYKSDAIVKLSKNQKAIAKIKLTVGLVGDTTFTTILTQIESNITNTSPSPKRVAAIAILSCIYGAKRIGLSKPETLFAVDRAVTFFRELYGFNAKLVNFDTIYAYDYNPISAEVAQSPLTSDEVLTSFGWYDITEFFDKPVNLQLMKDAEIQRYSVSGFLEYSETHWDALPFCEETEINLKNKNGFTTGKALTIKEFPCVDKYSTVSPLKETIFRREIVDGPHATGSFKFGDLYQSKEKESQFPPLYENNLRPFKMVGTGASGECVSCYSTANGFADHALRLTSDGPMYSASIHEKFLMPGEDVNSHFHFSSESYRNQLIMGHVSSDGIGTEFSTGVIPKYIYEAFPRHNYSPVFTGKNCVPICYAPLLMSDKYMSEWKPMDNLLISYPKSTMKDVARQVIPNVRSTFQSAAHQWGLGYGESLSNSQIIIGGTNNFPQIANSSPYLTFNCDFDNKTLSKKARIGIGAAYTWCLDADATLDGTILQSPTFIYTTQEDVFGIYKSKTYSSPEGEVLVEFKKEVSNNFNGRDGVRSNYFNFYEKERGFKAYEDRLKELPSFLPYEQTTPSYEPRLSSLGNSAEGIQDEISPIYPNNSDAIAERVFGMGNNLDSVPTDRNLYKNAGFAYEQYVMDDPLLSDSLDAGSFGYTTVMYLADYRYPLDNLSIVNNYKNLQVGGRTPFLYSLTGFIHTGTQETFPRKTAKVYPPEAFGVSGEFNNAYAKDYALLNYFDRSEKPKTFPDWDDYLNKITLPAEFSDCIARACKEEFDNNYYSASCSYYFPNGLDDLKDYDFETEFYHCHSYSDMPLGLGKIEGKLPNVFSGWSGLYAKQPLEDFHPRYYRGPFASTKKKFLYPNAERVNNKYQDGGQGFPLEVTFDIKIEQYATKQIFSGGKYSVDGDLITKFKTNDIIWRKTPKDTPLQLVDSEFERPIGMSQSDFGISLLGNYGNAPIHNFGKNSSIQNHKAVFNRGFHDGIVYDKIIHTKVVPIVNLHDLFLHGVTNPGEYWRYTGDLSFSLSAKYTLPNHSLEDENIKGEYAEKIFRLPTEDVVLLSSYTSANYISTGIPEGKEAEYFASGYFPKYLGLAFDPIYLSLVGQEEDPYFPNKQTKVTHDGYINNFIYSVYSNGHASVFSEDSNLARHPNKINGDSWLSFTGENIGKITDVNPMGLYLQQQKYSNAIVRNRIDDKNLIIASITSSGLDLHTDALDLYPNLKTSIVPEDGRVGAGAILENGVPYVSDPQRDIYTRFPNLLLSITGKNDFNFEGTYEITGQITTGLLYEIPNESFTTGSIESYAAGSRGVVSGYKELSKVVVTISNLRVPNSSRGVHPYDTVTLIEPKGKCTIEGEFRHKSQEESAIYTEGLVFGDLTPEKLSPESFASDVIKRSNVTFEDNYGASYVSAPSKMLSRKNISKISGEGKNVFLSQRSEAPENYNKYVIPALSELAKSWPGSTLESLPPTDGVVYPNIGYIPYSAAQGQEIYDEKNPNIKNLFKTLVQKQFYDASVVDASKMTEFTTTSAAGKFLPEMTYAVVPEGSTVQECMLGLVSGYTFE